MSKQRSIKINAILNTVQTIVSMVFPLITYPYVARVLGTEQLGKYNFSSSVVSYFSLLAGLGIATYAVREGTRLRDNEEKFSAFTTELFTINIYSTIISYILLAICLVLVKKLNTYCKLIFLISIPILFSTLGRSWIYSIYENYLFITLRTIAFQFLSMILLFVLVKDSGDIYKYTMVMIISSIGKDILNIFDSRKYCKMKFSFRINTKHVIPILLIFSTTISTSIYQNTDVTMLGFWANDYYVGLYSVSVKIYYIIKQMLAAILIVSIPRFSYYLGNNDKVNYDKLLKKIFNMLIFMILPTMIGLIMLSRQAILLIGGKDYLEASLSLKILSGAIIFNLFAYILGYGVLLPKRKENKLVIATIISAVVNLLLNVVLIPKYYQNAAAVTTLIAEIVSFIVCLCFSKSEIDFKKLFELDTIKNIIGSVVGCALIILICSISSNWVDGRIGNTIIVVITSAIVYMLVNLVVKNPIVLSSIASIKERLHI